MGNPPAAMLPYDVFDRKNSSAVFSTIELVEVCSNGSLNKVD
jgi:hypothetical protein